MASRCLCRASNGWDACLSACETCERLAGNEVVEPTLPKKGQEVLVLLDYGMIRVGHWDGARWRVHSDGFDRYLLSVNGWLYLPEIKEFHQTGSRHEAHNLAD